MKNRCFRQLTELILPVVMVMAVAGRSAGLVVESAWGVHRPRAPNFNVEVQRALVHWRNYFRKTPSRPASPQK